ncbi:MAG: DNA internalization-related competence protein ComEC/Rec2 [Lachnospiraceae bacterium]|nr:DNA internalization-related competence protein ComEC/Rec2 [Lachnospiraceae bacterium]
MILQEKRHLCLFVAAYLFGTVLYCRREAVWIPILLVLGLVLFFGIASGESRGEKIAVSGILIALILTSFFVCGYQDHSSRRIQELLKTDPQTELSGRVLKKEIRSDQCLYYLNTQYKKVIIYFDTDEIPIGSEVTVRGKWSSFSHASNEGSFDFAQDYADQNISFRIFADDILLEREPVLLLREGLYRLQQRICTVFADSLCEQEAGVLSALCVGNRGVMDPDVREMYQEAGISHILAISGLHISILGFGLYRFLRKIRLPCHLCEGIGCGVIVCFVVMSGMSTSACRALIMYLLLMGSYAFGRTYDPPNALALAALILLIPNPMNLYRSGFQFSFLSMAAITLFNAIMRRLKKAEGNPEEVAVASSKKKSIWQGAGIRMMGAFMFSACLQLALLPLTAWHYYEVPLYATFLNLLILPLCSGLLGFGLAGGFLGIFFPQAAKWLFIPCHFILLIYEKAITLVNNLPLSQWITGKPPAWIMLAFYLALAGVCLFFLIPQIPKFIKTHGRWFVLIPPALLFCILFVPERQYCRLDVLDVGQGDGIFLTNGAGTHVMIDGGSSTVSSVGSYEIEPFLKYHGIREIDVWIVTHGDLDHYSGLLEVLEDGYRVECLVFSEAMPHDEAWETLTAAAAVNGTEVLYAKAGDELALEGCKMTCLYPAAEDAQRDLADDANEFSQVWLFQRGEMSALFTGDLGAEQERQLLEREALTDCVLLKAAHHGSKYSTCEEFLKEVSPEYAVISCGEHNVYGHPAPETMERLANAGCEIYQTPQCGQLTFYEKKGRWRLRAFLP